MAAEDDSTIDRAYERGRREALAGLRAELARAETDLGDRWDLLDPTLRDEARRRLDEVHDLMAALGGPAGVPPRVVGLSAGA